MSDNYIDRDTFLDYLNARLTNAHKGADSSGIALHYPDDAKSFRIECKLIPELIQCVLDDTEDDLSPASRIQLDYFYWHCVLITYCWKYEFLTDGFFHHMAKQIYTYRNQQLEELRISNEY